MKHGVYTVKRACHRGVWLVHSAATYTHLLFLSIHQHGLTATVHYWAEFRYASPHLSNQLPVSFRQPCTGHSSDDVTYSVIHLPPAHYSHPPSHTIYFIPVSKITFSTNLFHHSLLAPIRTAFSDYTGPDLLCSTIFAFLVTFLSFYFGSCSRLSWLNCQLSSAR